MIQRLPKKYRAKHARKRGMSGQILFFAFKVIGPVALFFIAAVGLDAYSLLR